MTKGEKEKTKNKLKLIILIVVAILAFLISILMTLFGIKQTLDPNSTSNAGLIGFTTPSIDNNKKEKEIEKNNEVVEEEKNILSTSTLVNRLNNNGWDRLKSKLGDYETKDDNGNYYFSEGYTLNCSGSYVQYIIFDENYEGRILGEITTKDSNNVVEETLGEPTYKNKQLNMIGYKTTEIYVFFYEDEIVVYPNRLIDNTEFEKFLIEYYLGEYNGKATNFVIDLKRDYPDFTANLDSQENVVLTSITRKIQIVLDKTTGSPKVTIYNGYKYGESLKSYFNKDNSDFIKSEDDIVSMLEEERKA